MKLAVQIRDIRLHPNGKELEVLYEQAQKRVGDHGFEFSEDIAGVETQKPSTLDVIG